MALFGDRCHQEIAYGGGGRATGVVVSGICGDCCAYVGEISSLGLWPGQMPTACPSTCLPNDASSSNSISVRHHGRIKTKRTLGGCNHLVPIGKRGHWLAARPSRSLATMLCSSPSFLSPSFSLQLPPPFNTRSQHSPNLSLRIQNEGFLIRQANPC